jgi:hypothetical protein
MVLLLNTTSTKEVYNTLLPKLNDREVIHAWWQNIKWSVHKVAYPKGWDLVLTGNDAASLFRCHIGPDGSEGWEREDWF